MHSLLPIPRVLTHTMEQRECARWQWSAPQETGPPSSSPMLPATTTEPQWKMDRFLKSYSTLKRSVLASGGRCCVHVVCGGDGGEIYSRIEKVVVCGGGGEM